MYAAFARLNYKPWYALAEFVDNSLQSAITNIDELRRIDGESYQLTVDLTVSDEEIIIRDNAGGIAAIDYSRAFLPASPPPDTEGLSEFGLGMKAAASWFAEKWSVRTCALGEEIERLIEFDIPTIVAQHIEELDTNERIGEHDSHYTTLRLSNLRVRPQTRTLTKITSHLGSIYRKFIIDGFLQLKLNGVSLSYESPEFLLAPHYKEKGSDKTWRKEFELDLGDGHTVTGWAGILSRASVTNAGFAVFRRRRLILGSHGEGYRPEIIFGKPNKFVYQRLVGELEVGGFSVSHTKDGIQWSDWEDDILDWIKDELDSEPLPLLLQATHYRARPTQETKKSDEAIRDTITAMTQHLAPVVDDQLTREPGPDQIEKKLSPPSESQAKSETISIRLPHANMIWHLEIEIASDPSIDNWYQLSEHLQEDNNVHIQLMVNLAHPFLERFVTPGGDGIMLFTRLAAGLAISEITARLAGVKRAGTVRANLNQILRSVLSEPTLGGDGR